MQNMKQKVVQGYRITATKIGEGAFGSVYLGYDTNNQQLAVKVISRDAVQGRIANYLHNQIFALKSCRNDNIVKFIDIKKTSSYYYVFLEYCQGGDLNKYIRSRGKIPEQEALELFFQIIKGFRTITKKSLVHRDLKPANIFLKGGKIKIGDFGLAKLLSPENMACTFAGSPYNMAPEILRHGQYDTRADIYSIGTVLYEMIFGCPPFVGGNHLDLIDQIKKRRFHKFDQKLISKQTTVLLSRLLKQDPNQRMSWQQLFNYQTKRKNKNNAKLYTKYKQFFSKMNFNKLSAIPGIFCLMNSGNCQDAFDHCEDAKFLDLDLSSTLFVNLIKSTSIQE